MKLLRGKGGFKRMPMHLKILSKSLVESRLHYGTEIMEGCSKKEQKKNDSLLYRCRNIVAGTLGCMFRGAVDAVIGELSLD